MEAKYLKYKLKYLNSKKNQIGGSNRGNPNQRPMSEEAYRQYLSYLTSPDRMNRGFTDVPSQPRTMANPGYLQTMQPPAPRQVQTMQPPTPRQVQTMQPPAPRQVQTMQPPAPRRPSVDPSTGRSSAATTGYAPPSPRRASLASTTGRSSASTTGRSSASTTGRSSASTTGYAPPSPRRASLASTTEYAPPRHASVATLGANYRLGSSSGRSREIRRLNRYSNRTDIIDLVERENPDLIDEIIDLLENNYQEAERRLNELGHNVSIIPDSLIVYSTNGSGTDIRTALNSYGYRPLPQHVSNLTPADVQSYNNYLSRTNAAIRARYEPSNRSAYASLNLNTPRRDIGDINELVDGHRYDREQQQRYARSRRDKQAKR